MPAISYILITDVFEGNLLHWSNCFFDVIDLPEETQDFQVKEMILTRFSQQDAEIQYEDGSWWKVVSGEISLDYSQRAKGKR